MCQNFSHARPIRLPFDWHPRSVGNAVTNVRISILQFGSCGRIASRTISLGWPPRTQSVYAQSYSLGFLRNPHEQQAKVTFGASKHQCGGVQYPNPSSGSRANGLFRHTPMQLRFIAGRSVGCRSNPTRLLSMLKRGTVLRLL